MVRYGSNGLGDLLWHITWIQHFSHQVFEGVAYPRWLAGTNYGYGSPTFVFYPPLSYYLGTFFKSLGLNIDRTLSVLFTGCIFLAGFNFYIYGRYRWGKIAGIVGGIYYMSLPGIFNSVFYGALASALATSLIPLGMYFTDRAVRRQSWCIFLAIFWFFIALTHAPSLLLFTLAWFGYLLALGLQKKWKVIVAPASSAFLGFGMASFYLIPAILEQKWINIDYMADSKGGWRENMLGSDSLPFFVLNSPGKPNSVVAYGVLCAIALFLALLAISLTTKKTQKKQKIFREAIGWSIALTILVFIMSQWSEPIWEQFSFLQKVQRPTRFLSLFSFCSAGLAATATQFSLEVKKTLKIFLALLLTLAIGFGLRHSYKLSRAMPVLHNPGRGEIVTLDRLKTTLYDPYSDSLIDVPEYRPLLPDGSPPPAPSPNQPKVRVVEGDAEIEIEQWGSYVRQLQVNAGSSATVRTRTYYYPAWKLTIDGQRRDIERPPDGTMEFVVEPGSSEVRLEYGSTFPFNLGIAASLASFVVFAVFSTQWVKARPNSLDSPARSRS
nr:6-pyruvoyl-tetrahydropterin synthase-related protein [Baaleninema simplex]